jgi:hypothetical protein
LILIEMQILTTISDSAIQPLTNRFQSQFPSFALLILINLLPTDCRMMCIDTTPNMSILIQKHLFSNNP